MLRQGTLGIHTFLTTWQADAHAIPGQEGFGFVSGLLDVDSLETAYQNRAEIAPISVGDVLVFFLRNRSVMVGIVMRKNGRSLKNKTGSDLMEVS